MRTEALAATPDISTSQLADSNIILLTQPPARCCVLLVDDDDVVVSHLAMLLRRAGYEVCTADSGARALDILDTRSCQIVLTDWNMPDMDGIALCRNFRLRAPVGFISRLILTIRNGSGDILAGLSAGADDYLVKGASAQDIPRAWRLDGASRTANRRYAPASAQTVYHR